MQNAKDTFYEVLRKRLAALNPERTMVVRGVVRPGVLGGRERAGVSRGGAGLLSLAVDCGAGGCQWGDAVGDAGVRVEYETAGTA